MELLLHINVYEQPSEITKGVISYGLIKHDWCAYYTSNCKHKFWMPILLRKVHHTDPTLGVREIHLAMIEI